MPRTAKPLSPTSLATLQAIADGVRHGFEIMGVTGLASGTVYPVLARLEEAGLVRSRWEAPVIARREKRPPRRYYQISAAGTRALAHSIEHYRRGASRRTTRTSTSR
ncbi:MAG: PadR family transcriptional regulator [Gemmatimonadaceae bacterium]|nr:PadR family transcriptional regulator [Gemmatimonadaceae bacterium]